MIIKNKLISFTLILFFSFLIFLSCGNEDNNDVFVDLIDTPVPESIPTFTPTSTPKPIPSYTATVMPSPTSTKTPTVKPTSTPVFTPTSTPTVTNTPILENTSTPEALSTPTPTYTPTPLPVPTATSTVTPTPKPVPTATSTVSPTPTPTDTPTPIPPKISIIAPELFTLNQNQLLDFNSNIIVSSNISEDIFAASINWGDGTSEEKVAVVQATGEVIGTHTYSNTGSFTIEITINSDSGGTLTRGIFVYVNPQAQSSY